MESTATNKLVLVGFMGTGKSSVCSLLSERLGWSRRDADEEIVAAEGRSIADIFGSDGEEVFRDMETRTLKRLLLDAEPAVIATGGGAVLRELNCQAMLQNGFVVALTAEPETIVSRVMGDKGRPLLQGDVETRVRTLMQQRRNAYDFAHLNLDTTALSTEEVAELIMKALLEKYPNLTRK
ncbi:shikimate kinase [Paenibacillus sp. CAU 1782]